MFPGIDGFHWTFGHILFLALFFAVALTILLTVASAIRRTARDFRTHRAIDFCWHSDFAELPEADRRCRHELAGRVIPAPATTPSIADNAKSTPSLPSCPRLETSIRSVSTTQRTVTTIADTPG